MPHEEQDALPTWFGVPPPALTGPTSPETHRLWNGFMTARLIVSGVLLVAQLTLLFTAVAHTVLPLLLCTLYLAAALLSRFLVNPQPLEASINPRWGLLVGIDILVFAAMQGLQGSNINYTPLFALPILFVSVLGARSLALGTAAGVTLLLLGGSYWSSLQSLADATPYLVQAALSGAGFFAVALLAHQLASRLVAESERARLQQRAATLQKRINELVIDSLPDGVLIVDTYGWARAANPAAREMLGLQVQLSPATDLKLHGEWAPIVALARTSLGAGQPLEDNLRVARPGNTGRQVRARTRLAQPLGAEGESLCVVFLQDLRELEARVRTEKLATMGRMSAAVAHEIRNPLAAISQANALLGEELQDPRLTRLSTMVEQNVRRLGKIVDDILDVSRVQPHSTAPGLPSDGIPLQATVHHALAEWCQQNAQTPPRLLLRGTETLVHFDADHLRRVLFNLLDNAKRYASSCAQGIELLCDTGADQHASMAVWSDGAALDPSVQQHLFEPFFSSDSRSSGLGLFICRELCERHGAAIHYRRTAAVARDDGPQGNAFVLNLRCCDAPRAPSLFTSTHSP